METPYDKENQRNFAFDCGRVGGAEGESRIVGDESNPITQDDGERLHASPEAIDIGGEGSIGKILSQLRELQSAHLTYVQAHEDRLAQRLRAAKEHHDHILQHMQELETYIIKLIGED